MTPTEKRVLERRVSQPSRIPGRRPVSLDLVMGTLIGLIVGSLPAVMALNDDREELAAVVWVVAGLLGLAVAGAVHWRRSRPLRDRRALYEWELSEGVVTEFDCSVSGAVEIYEGEDERSTYLLQVSPTQVLFLNGHYLYDNVRHFPAERFRLARAPHSWEVLTLEIEGPRLPSVPMVATSELRRRDLNDGDLLEGVIADFVDTA
jgi:hypothetical protein